MMLLRIVGSLQRTLRGRNALLNLFELWVGLAGIIAGIVFFYSPASINHDVVTAVVGEDVAAIWVFGYAIAGAMIWWGLLRPSPRWETSGLWLLGTATAVNGIAVLDVFELRGTATAALLFALTVASWLRALVVGAAALHASGVDDVGGG